MFKEKPNTHYIDITPISPNLNNHHIGDKDKYVIIRPYDFDWMPNFTPAEIKLEIKKYWKLCSRYEKDTNETDWKSYINKPILAHNPKIHFETPVFDEFDSSKKSYFMKFFEKAFNKKLKPGFSLDDCFGHIAFMDYWEFSIDNSYNTPAFNVHSFVMPVAVSVLNAIGPDKEAVYLSKMGVCPEHQGNGVGKKTLAHIIYSCKEAGYAVMYLRTNNNNLDKNGIPISEFYRKYGGAELIADVPELFENGGQIYRIVLDKAKASAVDDNCCINLMGDVIDKLEIEKNFIMNMPEDFYRNSKYE